MSKNVDQSFIEIVRHLLTEPNNLRSVLIVIVAVVLAYWLSRFLAKIIIWVAKKVSVRGDEETDDEKNLLYRQLETYLSIAIAVMRVAVVALVGYVTWRLLVPLNTSNQAANGLAAIGAGAVFVIFAGQTIGPILRDITAGAVMITEGWFHVGDYVKLEPFTDISGVVERFTLRSTRIRAINGEVIWVNNQSISGVHVTPRGVLTMSVEIFVNDKDEALRKIEKIISTMPKGKTMLARPLSIESVNEWSKGSWHITVVGQTPPRREWLIEEYFMNAVKAIDEDSEPEEKLLVLPPLVHMSDPTADRRLRRAVRVGRPKNQR